MRIKGNGLTQIVKLGRTSHDQISLKISMNCLKTAWSGEGKGDQIKGKDCGLIQI
jgi:hypothetical protein